MPIKKIINKIFPARVKLYQTFMILKNDFGFFRSVKKSIPVNKLGEAIPWYTYPAIEYLSQFDFSDKNILEFGSGYSSVFWSKKCKNLISIEHRKSWIDIVAEFIDKQNVQLLYKNENDYTEICKTSNTKFDIIIIDGIKRAACAREISSCLNLDSGIVILDNSDWYPETSKYLRDELNLFEIDFFGFGPINNYTSCTSIFITRNLTLKPQKKQPQNGIASINQNCENE